MEAVKILIVEDEILIADTIQRYLERQGRLMRRGALSDVFA